MKEEYKVECGDYMDSIRMVKESDTSHMYDTNEDYEGDFELKSVILNGAELCRTFSSDEIVKINAYEDDKNTVNLAFNENVTSASIVIKGDNDNIYSEVAVKKGLSSNHVTMDFKSNRLVEGYRMYVRAVDEKTGSWHLYKLYQVQIIHKKPSFIYGMERYNQGLAEQCALYSALAYKVVDTVNRNASDGFSYDMVTGCLSDRQDQTYNSSNQGCLDLRGKLLQDGYIVDDNYMYLNYFESTDKNINEKEAENNCSYSIVHNVLFNGKATLMVIIRGTDWVEWYGNMRITGEKYDPEQKYHSNFKHAEELVFNKVISYITDKKLKDPDIVITGHSRGAAVANLLAKDLIDAKENMDDKDPEYYNTVTAYTFATPYNTLQEDYNDSKYNNIYNFCFTDDFVPQVPMESWDYYKYGQTVEANSEQLSLTNSKFNKLRLKIRSTNHNITYASKETDDLILHISNNWEDVSAYYNLKLPKIPITENKREQMTLFQFMHNGIAQAIVEVKHTINKVPAYIDIFKKYLYIDEFRPVARYFVNGSDLLENYIFDTHNIDNYYAALLSGGFNTEKFKKTELTGKDSINSYLSSKQVSQKVDLVTNKSDDIEVFRKFLRAERDRIDADGKIVKTSACDLLGWDMDDISTWEGITIINGKITEIDLPLVAIGGKIDLSGLDMLESLKCIYNDFDEVNLDGCNALKNIVFCGNFLTTLDLSSCNMLESLDVSDNKLQNIQWGDHSHLKWLDCVGNYLDTDTDKSLLAVVNDLKKLGINPSYKTQRYDQNAEYSHNDIEFVREVLLTDNNEKLLGWDKEDLSTWTGIQWKTVAGKNYINRIDIARKELTGSLIVTDLKYVREIVCGGNRFKKLDITGCKSLEFVNCSAGELEELLLGDNDSLLYLDCLNNQLVVDDIEKECQKIASRTGSEVYYERQYINADRIAFCESECRILEQFADLDSNKEILNWNLDKPGMIPNIQWKVQDGVYRVKELKIYGDKVGGKLDLSGFEALSRVCLVGTEINQVILPRHMKEIEEGSFVNCRKLESVILPEKIISIGKQAFASCEKLHQIDFPSGLQKIGEEAFLNCYSLKEITLGKEISEIGKYAFAGCSNLKKAVFSGDAPQNPGDDIFYGTADDFCIYYEKDSKGWQEPYWLKYRTALLGESTSPTTPEPQKPASSSEPLPTQPPVKTNLPVNTSKPAETEEPESTAKPEHTWKPEETTAPSGVQEPKSTKDPGGDSPFQDTDQPPAASIPGEQKQQPQLNLETAAQSSDWAEGTVSGKKTGYKNMSYKVKKAKVLKYKLKKRKLKVVIRRDKNVTGYEVYYRKGKKGKYKVVRRKGWKNNVILLRNLKKGTFYVKVRVYKKVNGKKYYSKFTKSKKVTVR